MMTSTPVLAVISVLLATLLNSGCNGSEPIAPPPVTITNVSPTSGPTSGGTGITITGTHFSDVISVTAGGTQLAGRTVVSTNQITGTTPGASTPGATDVVVVSSSNGSDTCEGCFSYVDDQPSELDFDIVGLGDAHTCGITLEGAAYCWGDNQNGQLGTGTTSSTPTLVPQSVAGGLTFAALDGGAFHTCGVTTTGAAHCWGNNQGGALGDGTIVERAAPRPVAGGLSFDAVSAGVDHTCGVTAEGTAYCWGLNLSGELGDGTTTTRTVPVPVAGGLHFSSVTAGAFHSCGLTPEGMAYCWGNNTEGELGDGTTTQQLTPTPVEGGLSFIALSAGFGYTCGITTGDAYCWGYNNLGRLGDGGPEETVRSSPSLVAGGLTFGSVGLASGVVSASTCGLTTAGVAFCWGRNTEGQLGVGTTANQSTPVSVAGGLSFTLVSTGAHHTCGVTTAGEAYCWGQNDAGELGAGTLTASTVPVKVAGQ